MILDNIHIHVKAGDGGNGAVSFHRESIYARRSLMAATEAAAET